MFTVFDIGPWVIEADAAETRKQYEKPWDDRCDCANCRNFSEAMNLLPAEKTRLFTQFGIRPSVCHDLGEIGKENGRHHYAGSYPIVGRLGEGWPKSHIEKAGDIRFSFSLPSTRFFIPKDFPDPIIHLDFSLLLPWVLEEEAD
ncbi:hypothetical protein [Bacillus amyloliquefaciens]|uniref:hypothetical protein n=1 Tax=Bacillus amyloliquefaciens TaxID=1390 RepID=UPI002DB60693|nr:hypothetical protein [Bacillus amyloliquefaciens]MEC3839623.1 hypothetical protein [Bacillus amyloliquefaciens]